MKKPLGLVVRVVGLLLVTIGVSGCLLGLGAAVLRYPPPLPEPTVVLPGPQIPPELAAFAGSWATEDRTWRAHILVVEQILSPEDLTVVFAIGGTWRTARSERVKARFAGDKLVVGSGAWKGVYGILNDRLSAELIHPGHGVRHEMLHKTELSEIRKIASGKE